jgi:hypothetical protein
MYAVQTRIVHPRVAYDSPLYRIGDGKSFFTFRLRFNGKLNHHYKIEKGLWIQLRTKCQSVMISLKNHNYRAE